MDWMLYLISQVNLPRLNRCLLIHTADLISDIKDVHLTSQTAEETVLSSLFLFVVLIYRQLHPVLISTRAWDQSHHGELDTEAGFQPLCCSGWRISACHLPLWQANTVRCDQLPGSPRAVSAEVHVTMCCKSFLYSWCSVASFVFSPLCVELTVCK